MQALKKMNAFCLMLIHGETHTGIPPRVSAHEKEWLTDVPNHTIMYCHYSMDWSRCNQLINSGSHAGLLVKVLSSLVDMRSLGIQIDRQPDIERVRSPHQSSRYSADLT